MSLDKSARAGAVARWWGTIFVNSMATETCDYVLGHRSGHPSKAEAVQCGRAMLAARRAER